MWKKEWKAISIFNFAKTQISWKWFYFQISSGKNFKVLIFNFVSLRLSKIFLNEIADPWKTFFTQFFLLPPTTTSAAASLSRKKSENDWQLRSALFVRAALIKNLVGGIRNKKNNFIERCSEFFGPKNYFQRKKIGWNVWRCKWWNFCERNFNAFVKKLS